MLNFRKLRKDFSPNLLKEGRSLYEESAVVGAKIVHLGKEGVRLVCKVSGNYENTYEGELEIDRELSEIIDSNCDCPQKYDCQHLAAIIFYLEQNIDDLVAGYSNANVKVKDDCKVSLEDKELQKTIDAAKEKVAKKKSDQVEKETLSEYLEAMNILASSPYFIPDQEQIREKAELAVIFQLPEEGREEGSSSQVEVSLALRTQNRSKPLQVSQIREFIDGIRYKEPVFLAGKSHFFEYNSFSSLTQKVLKLLVDYLEFSSASKEQRHWQKVAFLEKQIFAEIAYIVHLESAKGSSYFGTDEQDQQISTTTLPLVYHGGLEHPLQASIYPARIVLQLETMRLPTPKILLKPYIALNDERFELHEVVFLDGTYPGLIKEGVYYNFPQNIRRAHLKKLFQLDNLVIPEPLIGTFIENSLPDLQRFAQVIGKESLEPYVTLPYVNDLKARCELTYLDGKLEASLYFCYDEREVPAASSLLEYDTLQQFVSDEGILARNLWEEQRLVRALFQDFVFEPDTGSFVAKSDKKVVQFMTETVPEFQEAVDFECPENLLNQFVYDESKFKIQLKDKGRFDSYEVYIEVKGALDGYSLQQLWDCVLSDRSFIELREQEKAGTKKSKKPPKILVIDLVTLAPIVRFLDDLGLESLAKGATQRPLWTLAHVFPEDLKGLPIEIEIDESLKERQKQMRGQVPFDPSPIPTDVKAKLRDYQLEGVEWMERLRSMHLNGILADDMGLGKTLQAITAISQASKGKTKGTSLVVCPTSLLYNWKEELHKFNPKLKALVLDGVPSARKKQLKQLSKYDVIITSYTLLQKDVTSYKEELFSYVILDEAQHIKNRFTRNAKAVKQVQGQHKLILTGTPVENSLQELWSLFDFLMPGFLGSFERFMEKYIRIPAKSAGEEQQSPIEGLKKKVGPFVLRRMKEDVLKELPPVAEIVQYCHLSDTQKELYQSYADSAREELTSLVNKEGFDSVQIHVLATLTRLKQICCHPAIFAKEKAEVKDSAKYALFMELVEELISGNHKAVIFSQYTKMLHIIREDLIRHGIRFCYLDGSTKNRLEIVDQFNNDKSIPLFLVSLKAGGTGLNLVGADTVIHYDMWWNPAVENQATDRVHRIGQQRSVSSYKLVTLGTIEEKIIELQNRKKGLAQKVITSDDEALTKLTWEEVLELLQP